MKTIRKSLSCPLFCGLAAGLLSACGGGNACSIDQSGAVKAAAPVLVSHRTVQTQLQAGGGNGLIVTTKGSMATYSGTLVNPAGGSLSIAGFGSADGSSSTLTVTFGNWVHKEDKGKDPYKITLSGPLTETTTTASGGTNVTTTYAGTLQISGSVCGSADYNLTDSVANSCETISGSVSGNDVTTTAGSGCGR